MHAKCWLGTMKPLTESVLRRLTSEALVTAFGQAEKFECTLHPGCTLALTGEPIADMNYVVAGRGASDGGHFAAVCMTCASRQLPFLAIVFPEAESGVEQTAGELGLVHIVDFPFMVRDDAPIEPDGNPSVDVRLATGPEGAEAWARVQSLAFGLPEDAVRRAVPASVVDAPNVDVFMASIDDEVVGTVSMVHHGDTSSIWTMGTDPARQRSGIGRRLLSMSMAEARTRGATRFFLGATPAGYRLYESLGFKTRVVTKVWTSGDTGQA